jgi:hypothetical protein
MRLCACAIHKFTGDLDLMVTVTWVTMYYENVASLGLRHPLYVDRPSVYLVITSLRFYGVPVLYDVDNDGEHACLCM